MNKLSGHNFYKSLKRLYYILTVTHIVFVLAAAFLLLYGNSVPVYTELSWLKYLVPMLIAGGLYEADVLYRKGLKRAKETDDFNLKIAHYRIAFVLRYLFWLAPSLFAVAAGVLTARIVYLAFSVLIIVISLANRPSASKAKKKLEV